MVRVPETDERPVSTVFDPQHEWLQNDSVTRILDPQLARLILVRHIGISTTRSGTPESRSEMLSNTETPKYYAEFRDAVIRGDIPVCQEVSKEMNRIDQLIENPRYYYDSTAIDGFIDYCESELTLTDGSPV